MDTVTCHLFRNGRRGGVHSEFSVKKEPMYTVKFERAAFTSQSRGEMKKKLKRLLSRFCVEKVNSKSPLGGKEKTQPGVWVEGAGAGPCFKQIGGLPRLAALAKSTSKSTKYHV
jgi:hypothetical protein